MEHVPKRLRGPGLGALLVLVATPASAGFLDFIREYDLNDYAFGVSVSVSQTPFEGAGSTILSYPYLTSFEHPAFTNDWLLFSDGDAGVRYVAENGFVIGAVGRLNGGGFGTDVQENLTGLRTREWTAELGALLGWRYWPVHAQLKSYADVLQRHDGSVTEFGLSYPRQYGWGYVVPSIEAIYQSSAYNRYYFGITEPETRPGRPVYTPAGDFNYRLRLRTGIQLSNRWLLSLTVAAESLGDEVTNSPIVGRDTIYSYDVGLAYNADIFNPRDFPYLNVDDSKVELRMGAFWDNIDSEVQLAGEDGIPGDRFDLEKDGNADDSKLVGQVELIVRLGNYHRLDFGAFQLSRDTSGVAAGDFFLGPVPIMEGDSFFVDSSFRTIQATYGYSFMRDSQKELAIGGGLHRTRFVFDIETGNGSSERVSGDAILPVIRAAGSVSLGLNWMVEANLHFYRSVFDNYDGYMISGNLDASRRISRNARIGGSFRLYLLDLESTIPQFNGTYRALHYGPALFVSVGF